MRSNFIIIDDESDKSVLTIRDVGGPLQLTVTNDAEAVVEFLATGGLLANGRKLNYYDSDGQLDQLLVENGKFAGFATAYRPQ